MEVASIDPDLELTNPAGFADTTTMGRGRAWLASWLDAHTDRHPRSLAGAFGGPLSAAAVLTIDDLAAAALFDLRIAGGFITYQATLRWRDAAKSGGSPDSRIAWVDRLVERYLSFWADGDPPALQGLYASGAEVVDRSGAAITAPDLEPSPGLRGASLAEIGAGGKAGPAVFVDPGADTSAIAFVIDTPSSCSPQTLVMLNMAGTRIASERRLGNAADMRSCLGSREGWWIGLKPPGPIDAQVTGSIVGPDGVTIPIVNGTPQLEELARWGFGRFAAAGLAPPQVESISFAPVPRCRDVAGVVVDPAIGGTGSQVVQCTDAFALCIPDPDRCDDFDVSVRFGFLHELAHVWLLDSAADDSSRSAFLAATGLQVWRGGDTPWHLRGVERAADTLAWGLMDDPVGLTRFDDPPCRQVRSEYEILTGSAPPRSCPP